MSKSLSEVWMSTYKATKFHPWGDDPSEIDINIIARSLAKTNRWRGQFKTGVKHYSVAQHSIYVSWLLPKKCKLMGLLHDAGEFALGDMPTPIKAHLPDFTALEDHILGRVMRRFAVPDDPDLRTLCKAADKYMGWIEAQHLLTDPDFVYQDREPPKRHPEMTLEPAMQQIGDVPFVFSPWSNARETERTFVRYFKEYTQYVD